MLPVLFPLSPNFGLETGNSNRWSDLETAEDAGQPM